MKTNPHQHLTRARLLLAAAVLTQPLAAAGLTGRWSFEETASPYSDSGPNSIPMVQDTDSTTAISNGGVAGNGTELNWQDPPAVATRLAADGAAIQTDSFGFSFWINPIYLQAFEVLAGKEMAFDNSVANYLRKAWQVQVTGSGQLELIVRGDTRPADFFGAVQSSVALALQTDSPDWVHIAGGYDAVTGALSLYVDGSATYAAGTAGATNSDGAPFVLGSQRNGTDFIESAAGAQFDEVQLFDGPLTADEVAFLRANPSLTVADRPLPTLSAHWTLDEAAAPYPNSASGIADLEQDTETTDALSENPSLIGNAAVLNFGSPPVATRLFTDADAVQSDSFSFSFWLRPDGISGGDTLLTKECPEDLLGDPAYSLCSWKLTVLDDGESDGFSPLQLVVRGADRSVSEPFFGDVTSSAQIELNTSSSTWIHVAGGYDAATGAIALYVNDGDTVVSSDSRIVTPGADNSDGSPFSVGSARNGTDFVGFAAGAAIDDLQFYQGLLTAAQVDELQQNPGLVLVAPSDFMITSYSYGPVTGDMQVSFESIAGATYEIDASVSLDGWDTVKSVVGNAVETSVTITKAELDAALGATPRPRAFIRIVRP